MNTPTNRPRLLKIALLTFLLVCACSLPFAPAAPSEPPSFPGPFVTTHEPAPGAQFTQVYIVRLWKEINNGDSWHGKIQNVRSGQSRIASNLDELANLFHRYFHEQSKLRPKVKKV